MLRAKRGSATTMELRSATRGAWFGQGFGVAQGYARSVASPTWRLLALPLILNRGLVDRHRGLGHQVEGPQRG